MIVSIIIPIYNVELYVERCLESVFSQTYKNIEIILVDDCGSDNSLLIAKKVADKYSKRFIVKYIHHQENKGLSAARNSGILASTGDYIYFLDSDDTISPKCIEELCSLIGEIAPDFIIGNYNTITETGDRCNYILNMDPGLVLSSHSIINAYKAHMWYEMAWNKLVKKKFIIDNNLFFKEGIIHEDELWSFMLACIATSMGVVMSNTYTYYKRTDSITGSVGNSDEKLKKSCFSKTEVIKYMYDFLINNHKLKENRYIVYAYESKKYALFISIQRCGYFKIKELYTLYKDFRSKRLISNSNIFQLLYLDKKLFIKTIHYLFPQIMGFCYFMFLQKLKVNFSFCRLIFLL